MLPEISDLKHRRKQLGITQSQIAILAGVSQSLVTKVEAGKLVPSYANAKKLFDVLEARGLEGSVKASEIMSSKVVSVAPGTKVGPAIRLMHKKSISQMPVIENSAAVGSFSEKAVVNRMRTGSSPAEIRSMEVAATMDEAMPTINASAPLSVVSALLEHSQGVLVAKNGRIRGIITKADLLGIMLKTGRRRENSRF